MSYRHQPIEDMLDLLEKEFPETTCDERLGHEDFYFPGEPFYEYRVLGKWYSFIFVQDGPMHSYVFATDHKTGESCSCFTFDQFKSYVDTMKPGMAEKNVGPVRDVEHCVAHHTIDERIAELKAQLKSRGILENNIHLYLVDAYAFKAGHEPLNPVLPAAVSTKTHIARRHSAIMLEIEKAQAAFNPKCENFDLMLAYSKLYALYHDRVVEAKDFYAEVGPMLDELMELLRKRALEVQ